MLYQKPSFTVPASAGTLSGCVRAGEHCGPDAKGKCLRCGEAFDVPPKAIEPPWVKTGPGQWSKNYLRDT